MWQAETRCVGRSDAGVPVALGPRGTLLPSDRLGRKLGSQCTVARGPACRALGAPGVLRPHTPVAHRSRNPRATPRHAAPRRRTPATPHAALQANAGGGESPPGRRRVAAPAAPPAPPSAPCLQAPRQLWAGTAAAAAAAAVSSLQPFGRCVTRRFLSTWRPGQVGGDGGQSVAAAGAGPHGS